MELPRLNGLAFSLTVDGKTTVTAPVQAPQALVLGKEPQANVERYDTLRGDKEVRQPIIEVAWRRRIFALPAVGSPFPALLPATLDTARGRERWSEMESLLSAERFKARECFP